MIRFSRSTLVVLLILSACGEDAPPDPRGVGEPARPLAETYEPNPQDPLTPSVHNLQKIPVGTNRPRTVVERRVTPTQPDPQEERDWDSELRGALGSIPSCLETGEELPETLSLRVQAFVSSAGRVTRGYVSSSALSTAATDCLRERIETSHFAPPEETGGRRVSATLRFARESVD